MAEITQLEPRKKSAASKARVGAMAAATVLALNRKQRESEDGADAERLRQRLVHELTWAARKMYGCLGFDKAEQLAERTLAKVREEECAKSQIRG